MRIKDEEFEKIKMKFINGNTQEKINIYVNAEGLSQGQYKELLRAFPLEELSKLEDALM